MLAVMREFARELSLCVCCATLVGCASVPVPAPSTPEKVDVKTDLRKPTNPSFNATVLNDATALNASFAASIDPDIEALTRLESSYTVSVSEDGEQLRIGDAVSQAGSWGTAVRFGGVQFGTRSSPNDDVLYSPRLATSGLAILPTSADALFASLGGRENLLARQSLSVNAPKFTGPNAINIVASDTFGRSEAMTAPLVSSTRLVESGCSDFSLGVGKVRRDFAVTSNDYGPVFANTTVACAAPFGFTVEGHGEYLADQVTALGFGIARHIGPIGTASFAVASSDTELGTGWLARVGFEHTGSLLNLAVRSRIQSREFRSVGSSWVEDPMMRRHLASVGLNLSSRASIAVAYAEQTTWNQTRADILSINKKVTLGKGSVTVTAGHSANEEIGSSFVLSYKRPLGSPAPRRAEFDESDLELLEVTVDKLGSGG
jgi:outer membrane usher protein FimD/PapC